MERVYVKTCFSLLVPLKSEYLLLKQADLVTEPTFGLALATTSNSNSRIFFKLRLFCKQRVTAREYEQQDCLCWAKRSPAVKKTDDEDEEYQTGFLLRLKVKQGAFDFRKVDKRFIRLQIECSNSEGQLLNTATSEFFQLLPRKRKNDKATLGASEVIIPLQWQNSNSWLHDIQNDGEVIPPITSEELLQQIQLLNAYQAHDELGMHIDTYLPSNTMQLHESSNSGDNIPQSSDESEQDYNPYTLSLIHEEHVTDDSQYMVLYNGNAEVVGNFRALNFYKASDINIKEDVRLLVEEHDPRSVLLKIDGVSYKFKPGTTHSTNKRFVGYIAQQIESVVPEAVQLIDGILHVDYESLIPYLSESIKQNFNDIKRSHVDIDSIKSEQDRIIALIDMLYNAFLQQEHKHHREKRHQNEGQQSSPTRWPRVLLVLLGVLFTLSAVLVGLYFALDHNMFGNNDIPFNTDVDRQALEDLYHATNGPQWNLTSFASPVKWLSEAPICSWFGVECFEGRLSSLKLVAINLQGTIPHSIGNINLLNELNLMQNNLTGQIPDSIFNLRFLTTLLLGQNNLSGTIPNSINKLQSLAYLNLEKNPNLSGTIPNFPKFLYDINISQCNLHGTIPQSMSTLQHLVYLMLDHNQLSGTIPPLIAESAINLSNNQLEGTLPSFQLQRKIPVGIVSLDVSNNLISGTLQNLKSNKFRRLILHNNQFSGEVGYFDPGLLTHLDVSNNNFTSFDNSSEIGRGGPVCNASNNPFRCPIPLVVKQNCNATCI